MSLTVRELIDLPALPSAICEVAEAFVSDWVPGVALSDADVAEQLTATETRLGAPLSTALRWLYSRLGISGGPLFAQDPIVHLERLGVDEHGVVTFRTEQQGCVEWGYAVASGADPEVVMKNHMPTGIAFWRRYQSRLSHHVLEGVLSEAIWCSGTHAAGLDPTPQAIAALQALPTLGIPPHPFWAAADHGAPVAWYGQPDVVVRSDAQGWLWALGRTEEDLHRLMDGVPGEWQQMDYRPTPGSHML